MVSSVQASSSASSRSRPRPRPTAVSNSIHALVTPSASSGGSAVRKPLGSVLFERLAEQVGDPVGVLDGRDVPGERDQVAPEAGRGEHPGGAVDVAGGERLLEGGSQASTRSCGLVAVGASVGGRRWVSGSCDTGHTPAVRRSKGCSALQSPSNGRCRPASLRPTLAERGRLQRDPAGHEPAALRPRAGPDARRGDRGRPVGPPAAAPGGPVLVPGARGRARPGGPPPA